MVNMYMKGCSTSLIIMEIQIKMRYYKTPGRMTELKNIIILSVGEDVKQLELSCTVVRAVKWNSFRKTFKWFLNVNIHS